MTNRTSPIQPDNRSDSITGRHKALLDYIFYLPWGGEETFRKCCLDFIDLDTGESVLDVCCGRGEVLLALESRGPAPGQLVGIDIDSSDIESARNKNPTSCVSFLVADAANLPFESASFNACIISLGLHHAPSDQRMKMLSEVRRVLLPGGRLWVFDYHSPPGVLKRMACAAYALTDSNREALRMVKNNCLIQEIRQAGFEIEKWKNSGAGLLQFVGAVSMGKNQG